MVQLTHRPTFSLVMRPASARIARWWLTVGWLLPTGSSRSQLHAVPSGAAAISDSSRSRTGSARALNAPASSAAAGSSRAPEDVTCCYARQDKVWVDDPDGAPWEIYTVLADSDTPAGELRSVDVCGAGACATTEVPADR